jgi:hypothetical protein
MSSALYSMECSGLPCYDNIDISSIINCLYPKAVRKSEIMQIYSLYDSMKDLFFDSDKEVLPYVPNLC